MKRTVQTRRTERVAGTDALSPATLDIGDIDIRDVGIRPGGDRFGEVLLRKQLVAQAALVDALARQTTDGKRLGRLPGVARAAR